MTLYTVLKSSQLAETFREAADLSSVVEKMVELAKGKEISYVYATGRLRRGLSACSTTFKHLR